MEYLLIVFVIALLVLPRFAVNKISRKNQLIITCVVALLLMGLIWFANPQGHMIYKLVISAVLLISISIKFWKFHLRASK